MSLSRMALKMPMTYSFLLLKREFDSNCRTRETEQVRPVNSKCGRHCLVLLARRLEAVERKLHRHAFQRGMQHHEVRLPAGACACDVFVVRDAHREREARAAVFRRQLPTQRPLGL